MPSEIERETEEDSVPDCNYDCRVCLCVPSFDTFLCALCVRFRFPHHATIIVLLVASINHTQSHRSDFACRRIECGLAVGWHSVVIGGDYAHFDGLCEIVMVVFGHTWIHRLADIEAKRIGTPNMHCVVWTIPTQTPHTRVVFRHDGSQKMMNYYTNFA